MQLRSSESSCGGGGLVVVVVVVVVVMVVIVVMVLMILIIHKVMIRHFLGLADISDILRPSFLLLVTQSLPTVWPCSVPRNGGVCQRPFFSLW